VGCTALLGKNMHCLCKNRRACWKGIDLCSQPSKPPVSEICLLETYKKNASMRKPDFMGSGNPEGIERKPQETALPEKLYKSAG